MLDILVLVLSLPHPGCEGEGTPLVEVLWFQALIELTATVQRIFKGEGAFMAKGLDEQTKP